MDYVEGVAGVTGGTLPAQIWRDFMGPALDGRPVLDFPVAVDQPATRTATTSLLHPVLLHVDVEHDDRGDDDRSLDAGARAAAAAPASVVTVTCRLPRRRVDAPPSTDPDLRRADGHPGTALDDERAQLAEPAQPLRVGDGGVRGRGRREDEEPRLGHASPGARARAARGRRRDTPPSRRRR